MAGNVNKVFLMGNLTRDIEMRQAGSSNVANVGLAVNRTFKTSSGETREETTFVDVTFWGRQAEVIGEYMRKGRPIYVEGRLQLDQWEDKNTGQQRSRLKVVGENFQFLGGRDDRGGGQGGGEGYQGGGNQEASYGDSQPSEPSQQPSPSQGASQGSDHGPIEDDDDIPF